MANLQSSGKPAGSPMCVGYLGFVVNCSHCSCFSTQAYSFTVILAIFVKIERKFSNTSGSNGQSISPRRISIINYIF